MKSAKVLYFSGTGNSRYVAVRIASAFDAAAEYLPDIFKTCTSADANGAVSDADGADSAANGVGSVADRAGSVAVKAGSGTDGICSAADGAGSVAVEAGSGTDGFCSAADVTGSAAVETGSDSGPLVIVAPTYAYHLPLFIDEGLRKLTFAKGTAVYFVLTCGAGVGAAGKYNRSLAQACGLDYKGTVGVVMPENYLAMFTPPSKERSREIIRKAEPRIDEIIDVIKSSGAFTDRSGPVGAFESGPVNRIFFSRIIKDAKFRVAGQCSGCGACARLCPLGNISVTDGHPVWNGSCTHCMRCICCCPNEAIEYGHVTEKKRKYHFDKN